MKTIRPTTIVLTIAILAVVVEVAIFSYYAFAPIRVLEVKNIEILNPDATVITGQAVIYRITYCKYRQAQSDTVKALVGDVTYPLPVGRSNVPVGCHVAISRSTIIPVGVMPGKYRLSFNFTYQVNRLHTVHVDASSLMFTIVTGSTGTTPTQTNDSYSITPSASPVDSAVTSGSSTTTAETRMQAGSSTPVARPTQPSLVERTFDGVARTLSGLVSIGR